MSPEHSHHNDALSIAPEKQAPTLDTASKVLAPSYQDTQEFLAHAQNLSPESRQNYQEIQERYANDKQSIINQSMMLQDQIRKERLGVA
jgi:hypothetical protein